ncbi:MAG TPA: ribokinase [Puia sp.]|nr:ribokinase [Puia sp.]
MKKTSIVVVGSSNTDMVVRAAHLPGAGETIMGGTFFMNAGGKGANQAVAAARLGGAVTFIAKTGDDIFGRQAIELFFKEGIDTTCVLTDRSNPSGVALITVDDHAENCIVVAPGANAALVPDDISAFTETIQQASILLVQLEIPMETVGYAIQTAVAKQVKVILNPAPACAIPDELLEMVDVITPNETEAAMMTGVKVVDIQSAEIAARKLQVRGVDTVIITLGVQGAFLLHGETAVLIPAPVVNPVDTTAAGDIFNGALAVALSENRPMGEAVRFACAAASLSVTRLGAQASAPYRNELTTS